MRESAIRIKLQPRASRSRIEGFVDGALKIAVTSAPVGGAANEEMVKVLAEALDIPKRSISIKSGLKSRNKTVYIEGMSSELLREKLFGPNESRAK